MKAPAASGRPLDGITVVSLEHAIAAPFCTRQLADLGARVIKVERPGGGDFARAYEKTDVILTPTSPSVAFKFGSKTDNPLAMYLCDVFTIPTNLAGHPAMSVPFGTGADNMPVGVQVLATTLGEQAMFKVAAELERSL